MKKYIYIILFSLGIVTGIKADFSMGVAGSLAFIDATGTETEGTAADTSDRSKSVDNIAVIASIFAEKELANGATIGFELVPFSADVSDQTHSRTESSVAGSGEGVTGSNTRTADAEVELFRTAYVEYPIRGALFKLGYSQIDVNTKENKLTNGGTYGDATLDGITVGLGFKRDAGNVFYKGMLEYTDFETLKLNSSTNNKIEADLDVTQFKVYVGKTF